MSDQMKKPKEEILKQLGFNLNQEKINGSYLMNRDGHSACLEAMEIYVKPFESEVQALREGIARLDGSCQYANTEKLKAMYEGVKLQSELNALKSLHGELLEKAEALSRCQWEYVSSGGIETVRVHAHRDKWLSLTEVIKKCKP